MVNVGYPWLTIKLTTSMMALVTLLEMMLRAKRIHTHTVTPLIIPYLLTRVQMLNVLRRNPFKMSTPPCIQMVMTKKSIADLLLFLNPQPL
jgi:hypothetical protein